VVSELFYVWILTMSTVRRVAVLIDGGFFFHRVQHQFRKNFSDHPLTADIIEKIVQKLAKWHTQSRAHERPLELQRIFFYDCPPPQHQIHSPIKPVGHRTAPLIKFKDHPAYQLRLASHQRLARSRKVALRMGKLSEHGEWQIKSNVLKDLCQGKRDWTSVTSDDFFYDIPQKGVDIKLGIDIAHLSHHRLVDQLVFITGDTDFVPAAKMARAAGIDFILDPLWATVSDELHEHIDGLRSPHLQKLIENVLSSFLTPIDEQE